MEKEEYNEQKEDRKSTKDEVNRKKEEDKKNKENSEKKDEIDKIDNENRKKKEEEDRMQKEEYRNKKGENGAKVKRLQRTSNKKPVSRQGKRRRGTRRQTDLENFAGATPSLLAAKAIKKGRNNAKQEGQNSAKKEGRNNSNEEGLNNVKEEGRNNAKEEGLNSAKKEGRNNAKEDGRNSAKKEGRNNAKEWGRNSAKKEGRINVEEEGRNSAKKEGRNNAKENGRNSAKEGGQNSAKKEGRINATEEEQKSAKKEERNNAKKMVRNNAKEEGRNNGKEEGRKKWKSPVWSIREKHEYNIQLPLSVDKSIAWISGCHVHYTGEIIMTDFFNKRIKKLDRETQKVSMRDLPLPPVAMCYIGANIVAISLGRKLQFMDISGDMKCTRSVDLEYNCKGITYHNCRIFTVNENSVFMHDDDGKLERCLYTHHSKDAYFQSIVFNGIGTKMFISSWNIGLVVVAVANECYHVFTLFDNEMKAPFGITIDANDHVFLCLPKLHTVIQVSSDGKKKIGELVKKEDYIPEPTSLYFDRNTNSFVVGCGGTGKLCILQLC